MSLANPNAATIPRTDTRAAIVAALTTIPDVAPFASTPDNPVAGAAWPVKVQTTYAGRLGMPGDVAWDVYALLPADYGPETVAQGDALEAAIVAAVWYVGTVQTSEPAAVIFDNSVTMPAVRVRLVAH